MILWLGAILVGLSLGMLGGGGSVLAVPLLVYAGNMSTKQAIPASLALVGITSGVAAFQYALRKLIQWKTGLVFAAFSMLGAMGGARAYRLLSSQVLLILFAALMVVASVLMFRRPQATPCQRLGWNLCFCSGLIGVFTGFITGLLGAGGGFMIVPALVLLLGVEIRRAVATSVLIITLAAATALLTNWEKLAGIFHMEIWIFLGIAVPASLVGSYLAPRVPQQKLRKGFAAFILLVGIGLLLKEWILT